MKRSVTAALLCALGIALSGCGWLNPNYDARKDWQAADWYREAKEELDNGNWLAAVKLYGELEAKFPFGRYAQQAQLDTAYAYYKEGDAAQSIAAIDRFTKAYPNQARTRAGWSGWPGYTRRAALRLWRPCGCVTGCSCEGSPTSRVRSGSRPGRRGSRGWRSSWTTPPTRSTTSTTWRSRARRAGPSSAGRRSGRTPTRRRTGPGTLRSPAMRLSGWIANGEAWTEGEHSWKSSAWWKRWDTSGGSGPVALSCLSSETSNFGRAMDWTPWVNRKCAVMPQVYGATFPTYTVGAMLGSFAHTSVPVGLLAPTFDVVQGAGPFTDYAKWPGPRSVWTGDDSRAAT